MATWSLDFPEHIKRIRAVLQRCRRLDVVRDNPLDAGREKFADLGQDVVARHPCGVEVLHESASLAKVAWPNTAASIACRAASSRGRM